MKIWIFIIYCLLYNLPSHGQVEDDNLILYLPFENDFKDVSGNENIAINHGTTFVEDRLGNPNSAVYFDGKDDYIDIANKEILNFGTGDFTISFWLKYPSQIGAHGPSARGRIFDFATVFIKVANPDYPYEGITFFVDYKKHGYVHFRTSDMQGLNVQTDLNDNRWHYYVLRRKGNELSLFIDKKKVLTSTHSSDNVSNSAGIRLGANHVDVLSQNLEGTLDELKIYGKALEKHEF